MNRMDFRSRKIEELIKIKLSSLLLKGLKDPRLDSFITILDVVLSKDGRSARIVVSVIGTAEEQRAVIDGLHSARGYIQKRLSKQIRVKYFPHLLFILDTQTEERVRLVHKINEGE
jgi:ribosome-binding factor A